MTESMNLKKINKKIVMNDYDSAEAKNNELHLSGDVRYGSEYIYENQKKDASDIINKFYTTDVRVISVIKRTKLGMDGLMIEVAKRIATHDDDTFSINRKNVFFVTAMSNVSWESDFKEKVPNCFKDNIYHHGKLLQLKSKLKNIKNALIINDEIDTGDKENQRLHILLKESGILDIHYMKENNIRMIFVSATMVNEHHSLCQWGDKHYTHRMSVPKSYIGHKDFLERRIIKEYYPITNVEMAEKWIKEDIIDNYKDDLRIHIIRTDDDNKNFIKKACEKHNILFRNHNSVERIETEELNQLFSSPLKSHVVLAIKGLFRRANLIPNEWKLKIGATHERYTNSCEVGVQVQGLPGRMSGYWRDIIEKGYKTGPYRTSVEGIYQYENWYTDPSNKDLVYATSYGSKSTFLSTHNIKNLKVDDSENSNKRVPVIIKFENNDIFKLKTRVSKLNYITNLLIDKPEYTSLLTFIKDKQNTCLRILEPKTKNAYNLYINDVVKAAENNIPFNLDLPSKSKEKNNWQLYIDNIEKRLCFIVWCDNETY
jgi:hypothetical protein